MGLAESSEAAIAARKAAKEVNYSLDRQLRRDDSETEPATITYLSVHETEATISTLFHFLARYHPDARLLNCVIVKQIQYIIKVLQILTDYDIDYQYNMKNKQNKKNSRNIIRNRNKNKNKMSKMSSKFYCRQSYSTKWIMSMYPQNVILTYEEGKKILKVWNDASTQTLILLLRKYYNNNTNNNDNIDESDKHYYDFVENLLRSEYPIHLAFCEHFLANILKFSFFDLTMETDFERKLFIQCLTNNGKIPITSQQLIIRGFPHSFQPLCVFLWCCLFFVFCCFILVI